VDGRRGKLWFYFNTIVTSLDKNTSAGAATLFSCCLDNANSYDFYDGNLVLDANERRLPHDRGRQGLRRGAASHAHGVLGRYVAMNNAVQVMDANGTLANAQPFLLEHLQGRADRACAATT
jgi:hypothetical protein